MAPTGRERDLAHHIEAALTMTATTLQKERNVPANEGVTPALALAIALVRSGIVGPEV
jgi:Asp/Glu/hydantoin racemase